MVWYKLGNVHVEAVDSHFQDRSTLRSKPAGSY